MKTTGFNLKTLAPGAGLGTFAGEIDADGTGLRFMSMNATVKSNIDRFEFSGKTISNAIVDGQFKKGVFEGHSSVKDNNLDMSFTGKIDFNTSEPVIDVDADINKANLAYFGLDTGQSTVSGKINSDLKGNSIDNLVGHLDISQLVINKSGKTYLIENTQLVAEKESNYRNITLHSDVADVSIIGDFSIGRLPLSINNFFVESFARLF